MDKTLEPEISVKVGPVRNLADLSLKGGHISKIRSDELTLDTTYCTICRNIDAGILKKDSLHMELKSSTTTNVIIIPHSLAIFLQTLNLEPKELISLIHDLRTPLQRFYEKWRPTGRNPCKKNKAGRELEFQIRNNNIVKLWVIIDSIREKIAFRLSYGGGNVKCP